jgi:DNA-directed RNA polymerase subunit RPC12/RpoP
MSFCKKCGTKIDSDSQFCYNCGEKVSISTNEATINVEQQSNLECPYCKSHDVNIQIINENKNTGCLMIFIYIILALTIIGIPIMIIILLAKGQKTSSKTIYVCHNCGKTFTKTKNLNKKDSKKEILVATIVFIVAFFCIIFSIAMSNINEVNISKSEYEELNPQTLYNDYVDNELLADDKYKENYYYISGTIYDIEHFLTDNYLTMRFTSSRDNTKTIEITAYFNNIEELKEVKKDDKVTVYGKFYQRTFENYMNITVFSLKDCHLNVEE